MANDDSQCSICAGTMEGDMTTLECRHTFHVGCVIQWFRFHNQSCPNCRSCDSHEHWTRKTPQERVSIVRRRRNNPKHVTRLITQLDSTRAQTKQVRRDHVTYRREHLHVIKAIRDYHTKYARLRERERRLVLEIDKHCHTVPRMTLSGFVEQSSSGNEESSDDSVSSDSEE